MTISQIAELSNVSKSYISQVKHGKRLPSQKLIEALWEYSKQNHSHKSLGGIERAIDLFLKSRRNGVSQGTLDFYSKYLNKSIPVLGLTPKPVEMNQYLNSLSCSTGGKHAYYRAISVFYNWLYSLKSGYNFSPKNNPIDLIDAPKRPKLVLPSLSKEQVEKLIRQAHCTRDRAIIALFTESGLRLSELLNIKLSDFNWESRTIRVLGKGNKEGFAPFGLLSEQYLRCWLTEYNPQPAKCVWNIGFWGIKTMLDQLGKETGLHCNPHTFRRTFACLLRKAGVDTMTIKDLGRWENLEMVQRYTRSITFEDSLKFYKPLLSSNE